MFWDLVKPLFHINVDLQWSFTNVFGSLVEQNENIE